MLAGIAAQLGTEQAFKIEGWAALQHQRQGQRRSRKQNGENADTEHCEHDDLAMIDIHVFVTLDSISKLPHSTQFDRDDKFLPAATAHSCQLITAQGA